MAQRRNNHDGASSDQDEQENEDSNNNNNTFHLGRLDLPPRHQRDQSQPLSAIDMLMERSRRLREIEAARGMRNIRQPSMRVPGGDTSATTSDTTLSDNDERLLTRKIRRSASNDQVVSSLAHVHTEHSYCYRDAMLTATESEVSEPDQIIPGSKYTSMKTTRKVPNIKYQQMSTDSDSTQIIDGDVNSSGHMPSFECSTNDDDDDDNDDVPTSSSRIRCSTTFRTSDNSQDDLVNESSSLLQNSQYTKANQVPQWMLNKRKQRMTDDTPTSSNRGCTSSESDSSSSNLKLPPAKRIKSYEILSQAFSLPDRSVSVNQTSSLSQSSSVGSLQPSSSSSSKYSGYAGGSSSSLSYNLFDFSPPRATPGMANLCTGPASSNDETMLDVDNDVMGDQHHIVTSNDDHHVSGNNGAESSTGKEVTTTNSTTTYDSTDSTTTNTTDNDNRRKSPTTTTTTTTTTSTDDDCMVGGCTTVTDADAAGSTNNNNVSSFSRQLLNDQSDYLLKSPKSVKDSHDNTSTLSLSSCSDDEDDFTLLMSPNSTTSSDEMAQIPAAANNNNQIPPTNEDDALPHSLSISIPIIQSSNMIIVNSNTISSTVNSLLMPPSLLPLTLISPSKVSSNVTSNCNTPPQLFSSAPRPVYESIALSNSETTLQQSIDYDSGDGENLVNSRRDLVDGGGSLVNGRGNLVNGGGNFVDGGGSLVNGGGNLVDDGGSLVNGRGSLVNGRGNLVNGRGNLVNGGGSLVNGRRDLVDGGGSLVNGGGNLVNGGGNLVDDGGSLVNGRGSLVNGGGSLVNGGGNLVNGRVNNGEGPVNSGGVLVNSGGGLVNSGSCLVNSGSCPIINRFRVPVIEECQYDELSHSEDTISILSDENPFSTANGPTPITSTISDNNNFTSTMCNGIDSRSSDTSSPVVSLTSQNSHFSSPSLCLTNETLRQLPSANSPFLYLNHVTTITVTQVHRYVCSEVVDQSSCTVLQRTTNTITEDPREHKTISIEINPQSSSPQNSSDAANSPCPTSQQLATPNRYNNNITSNITTTNTICNNNNNHPLSLKDNQHEKKQHSNNFLFAIGDIVVGKWRDSHWYVASIAAIHSDKIHLQYFDGDQGAVNLHYIIPLNCLPKGIRLIDLETNLTGSFVDCTASSFRLKTNDGKIITSTLVHLCMTGKTGRLVQALTDPEKSNKLFNGLVIAVTERDNNNLPLKKSQVEAMIRQNGGTIVEDFALDLIINEQTFCVSNSYCRTLKYLMALTVNVPVVSYQWIQESIEQNKVLDYMGFILPAGKSTITHDLVQWQPRQSNFFASCVFHIIGKKSFKDFWGKIIQACGGSIMNYSTKKTIILQEKDHHVPARLYRHLVIDSDTIVECILQGTSLLVYS